MFDESPANCRSPVSAVFDSQPRLGYGPDHRFRPTEDRRASAEGASVQMRSQIIAAAVATSLATLAVLSGPAHAAAVDTARLKNSTTAANAGHWMSYGRDYTEQRYSPLKQINAANANQLGLAWYGDLYERGGSYET